MAPPQTLAQAPKQPRAFLDPPALAARWGDAVKVATLAKWRVQGTGPKFLKLGAKVIYPLDEVETWEAEHLRQAAG
jgi:hypothetical protein